jgi:uncharacterized protein YndB with AHSA1/START domain
MSTPPAEKHGVITEAGTIVFERILPGPIDRVWEYLTDSDKRMTWLASGTMEPKIGAKFELFFRNTDLSEVKEPAPERFKSMEKGVTMHCEITEWQKPNRLSFLWGSEGSEVSIELKVKGHAVILTLTHRKVPNRNVVLMVASGWHTHLGFLSNRLRGEPTRPFWSTFMGLYNDYEARIPA